MDITASKWPITKLSPLLLLIRRSLEPELETPIFYLRRPLQLKSVRGALIKLVVMLLAGVLLALSVDVTELKQPLRSIRFIDVLVVLLFVGLNFLTTSWRLTRIFHAARHPIRFKTGVLANMSGLLASLFVVNLLGSSQATAKK